MNEKLDIKEFLIKAIDRLKEPGQEGIHIVNSGLLGAMMKYYEISEVSARFRIKRMERLGIVYVQNNILYKHTIGGEFMFSHCIIREWHGRYGTIEGHDYVFRVRWQDNRWWLCISTMKKDYHVLCWAVENKNVALLVNAVNRGKNFLNPGHNGGGSFVINEFGQVIVPASDGKGRRAIVGNITGPIYFKNPLNSEKIDLSDEEGLKTGELWEKPYIGIPYNLSRQGRIYFWRVTQEMGYREDPPIQDHQLINKIREVRPYGAVRFIVNPYGIVLTKKKINSQWLPIFIGRINPQRWFNREE